MNAEIRTEKIGTKWHAYLDGRPDIDETALSEEAARRKVEQLRERLGTCDAKTERFGGRSCELVKGHHALREREPRHRSGAYIW
jgi:hypothetical protein